MPRNPVVSRTPNPACWTSGRRVRPITYDITSLFRDAS
jgi:hypothetical protein